jgi:hypothetical protein
VRPLAREKSRPAGQLDRRPRRGRVLPLAGGACNPGRRIGGAALSPNQSFTTVPKIIVIRTVQLNS